MHAKSLELRVKMAGLLNKKQKFSLEHEGRKRMGVLRNEEKRQPSSHQPIVKTE